MKTRKGFKLLDFIQNMDDNKYNTKLKICHYNKDINDNR